MTGQLEAVRALGITMGTWYAPNTGLVNAEDGSVVEVSRQRFIGWTTDETAATAAGDLGALLRPYTSREPRFSGWEVIVTVDTQTHTS